MLFKRVLLAFL